MSNFLSTIYRFVITKKDVHLAVVKSKQYLEVCGQKPTRT